MPGRGLRVGSGLLTLAHVMMGFRCDKGAQSSLKAFKNGVLGAMIGGGGGGGATVGRNHGSTCEIRGRIVKIWSKIQNLSTLAAE